MPRAGACSPPHPDGSGNARALPALPGLEVMSVDLPPSQGALRVPFPGPSWGITRWGTRHPVRVWRPKARGKLLPEHSTRWQWVTNPCGEGNGVHPPEVLVYVGTDFQVSLQL